MIKHQEANVMLKMFIHNTETVKYRDRNIDFQIEITGTVIYLFILHKYTLISFIFLA